MANLKERLPPLGCIISFEAAAQSGSYSIAARRLQVTPPAVSRQIGKLESFLGVKVFRPFGRGRTLTSAGRDLYEAVTFSLEHIAATVAKIKQRNVSAPLTIAMPLAFASLWLIPRIASFRQKYPDIELRFVTADADLDPAEENISLAVRYGSGSWPHLAVTPLLRPHIFPVCSPEFLRVSGGLSSMDDLLRQTLLDREPEGSFGINWNSWLSSLKATPKRTPRRIFFNSYEIVIRAALAGQGVALGVDVLVNDLLQQKLLVSPPAARVRLKEAYYLVSPICEELTPEMKAFSSWLLDEVGAVARGQGSGPTTLRKTGRDMRTRR